MATLFNGLTARMLGYLLTAGLFWSGVGNYDPATGDLTLNIPAVMQIIGGLGSFAGTFWIGRKVKARGGLT